MLQGIQEFSQSTWSSIQKEAPVFLEKVQNFMSRTYTQLEQGYEQHVKDHILLSVMNSVKKSCVSGQVMHPPAPLLELE